ncbi:MAG: 50S ribosomal protein L13 [Candidatus Absconditicoccaceae bacterium]
MEKFTKKDLNKTLRVKQELQQKYRKRHRVDADGKTLGRLAVDIANKLSGKGKVSYSDFWDGGDFVLVENVEKVSVTGKKLDEKIYYSYSGYKGNLKQITLKNLLIKNPAKALWFAVRGMIAKNKLRDSRMKRLKLVVGTTTKYDNFKPLNSNK